MRPQFTCNHCGATYSPKKHRPGRGHYFCSPACRNAARVVPLAERFWRRVDKSGPCWIWTGAQGHHGYGRIGIGGHDGPTVLAHRVAWELSNGPVPEGLCVLHRCDNPPCVNPDHLFVGTQADNIRDCKEKGRMRNGRGNN